MAIKISEFLPKINTKGWKSDQGAGSLTTFVLAAALLLLSIGLGALVVINIFMRPKTASNFKEFGLGFLVLPPVNIGAVIIVGILFVIAMIVAFVCVYIFNNQALKIVVRVYAWLCSAFGLGVYMKIAINFYHRSFDFSDRYFKYMIAVSIVTLAVFVLPLLFERYNVREFSALIFLGNLIHMMLLIDLNIIKGAKVDAFFWGDLTLFFLMIMFAVYFVRNAPFFLGIKRELDMSLTPKE